MTSLTKLFEAASNASGPCATRTKHVRRIRKSYTEYGAHLPTWRAHGRLNERLEHLRTLAAGWDTYRAHEISETAIDAAYDVLRALIKAENFDDENVRAMNIGPTADGGVSLEWSHGAKKLYVTFDRNGVITVLRSDAPDEEEDRTIDPAKLVDEVRWLHN
jgi:hypothetical protein